MVEIIYRCKQGKYPFGRERPGQETYFQHVIVLQNDEQVNKAKQINQILKQLDESCIMKLKKIFKEDNTLHMLYDYVEQSLNQKLQKLQDQQELTDIFVALERCFQSLINNKLKAQIYFEYMGIDHANTLKIWIKPDQCEICQQKKELEEFYQTERTRIHLQIEQVIQSNQQTNSKTGKGQTAKGQTPKLQPTQQKPNFVINGNQLVFKPIQSQSSGNQTSNNSSTGKQTKFPFQNQRPISKFQNKIINQEQLEQQLLKNISKERQLQRNQHISLKDNFKNQKSHVIQKLEKQKPVAQTFNKPANLKHKGQTTHQQRKIEVQKLQNRQQLSEKSNSEKQKSFQNNQNKNIHIRTELINKHKMRIITSQEIQLEGYDEKDLQRLANQKLKQLGKNSNMGKIQFQQILDTDNKKNCSQNSGQNIKTNEKKQYKKMHSEAKSQASQNKGNTSNYSSENGNEGNKLNMSEEMNQKINKAKERARQVLNQYSKKVKK